MSVDSKMTAIADNIRIKTGTTEALTLDDMASGVNDVYEAGKEKEWSDFWDSIQNYGKRKSYAYAFYCPDYVDWSQWNKETLRPKYDLTPTGASRMFYRVKGITDLGEHLQQLGIKLDLSKATTMNLAFCYGDWVKLPTIDCSNASSSDGGIGNMFNYCSKLETIEKWIMSEKVVVGNCFVGCSALKNIIVEGVIGLSMSFSDCPLTVESMKSVITHLKDCSGTESKYTYTVTFKSTAFSALTAEGTTSPNGNTWAEYIDDLKWNLVLA